MERFRHVVLGAALAALCLRPTLTSDMWWHLQIGQFVLETRTIPTTDPFTHTFAGAPWLGAASSWLADSVLFLTYRFGGLVGLNLLVALVSFFALVVVYRTTSGPELLRVMAVAAGLAIAQSFWSARPQMVSFLFAALFVDVLRRYRLGRADRLWLLPLGMLVWVNCHGGFAIGFVLMGLTLVGELTGAWLGNVVGEPPPGEASTAEAELAWRRAKKLAVVLLACLAAACCNPVGPRMLFYPFETLAIAALYEHIQEWNSPDFHQPIARPFLILFLATVAAVSASGRRMRRGDFFEFFGVAAMGFLANRNLSLLALVAPAVFTEHAEHALARWSHAISQGTERLLPAAALLVAVVVGGMRAPRVCSPRANEQWVAERFPVAACDYLLAERPAGELFNTYNLGGYLSWRLYPHYRVYVDGRTDLYSPEFLKTYFNTIEPARQAWEAVLADAKLNLVVVESASPLAERLSELGGWRRRYHDDLVVVCTREPEGQ